LRDSLALLRMAGRIARLGGWTLALPSGETRWSDEIFEILEWPTRQPPTLDQALDLYAPDCRERISAAVARCAEVGTPFDVEGEVVTGTGRRLWVRSTGEADRDEDGRIVRLVGAFQDLTEQRTTSSALRDVSDRLQHVLEEMPDAFCLLDRSWTFRYVNAAAERLARRPREALLGRQVWEEFPDTVALGVRDTLERGVTDGQPVDLELFYPPFDAWLEVHAHPSADGLAVYVRDVTTRKEAELALRASEERLRVLTTTTSDAIYEWDVLGGTLLWNEGIESLFGYKRATMDLTIDFWSTSIHPEDESRVTGGLTRSLACGDTTWADEYRFRRADGTYAHVFDRGRIQRDDEGRAIRMMGGITDVSDRKRLEAQVLRAQRMESIGTLAGGMAHDLNNVLAPIMLSLDVLREMVRDPFGVELIETIQRSAQRGADLVGQVLSFARGVEGERQPVHVGALVDDVKRLVLETFPKSIACVLDVPAGVWAVHGDRTQLHQVLMNLCVNARDAMPRGGVLTIGAANRTLDDAYAEHYPESTPGTYVVIQVDDTGTGLTPAVREKMFEPFFTTKATGQGTGLGLSTSLAIVRSHGGFIDVCSEVGRGTSFRVHLPATPVQETGTGARAAEAPPLGRGELILLVDDEEHVRLVAQRTLEHHGYRVVTAANGAEAVAAFSRHQSDDPIVLTDMTMPVMDGANAIAALRALNPNVRIIGSSGLGPDSDDARAVRAEVRHFVAKPYTAERLLRALRDVIDER